MGDDATSLLNRIRALVVEETSGAPDGLLGRIEHTLADGYAQALALERLRVEKEIALSWRGCGRATTSRRSSRSPGAVMRRTAT